MYACSRLTHAVSERRPGAVIMSQPRLVRGSPAVRLEQGQHGGCEGLIPPPAPRASDAHRRPSEVAVPVRPSFTVYQQEVGPHLGDHRQDAHVVHLAHAGHVCLWRSQVEGRKRAAPEVVGARGSSSRDRDERLKP